MIRVTVITVGNLKESYWREALVEYEKRLCAFCKPEIIQLKEARIGEEPTHSEIETALNEEGKRILAVIPPKSYKIALCVEGEQFSSEVLAKRLNQTLIENGNLCLIIGSSHGICEEVKRTCDLRLSISKLTFPHQMVRVMLLEILYRCFGIIKGTKYHK